MNWEVHTKGGPGRPCFEICVIRKTYQHGYDSYGWFGPDKLLITHNGGPCQWPLTQKVWDHLIEAAETVAAEMNAEEHPWPFRATVKHKRKGCGYVYSNSGYGDGQILCVFRGGCGGTKTFIVKTDDLKRIERAEFNAYCSKHGATQLRSELPNA